MIGQISRLANLFRAPRILGQGVPMYIHPSVDPGAWQALGRTDLGRGFTVANIANGPGTEPAEVYQEALATLLAGGSPVVGYVDSSYGRRGLDSLVADLERWRSFYSITGIFIDQTTAHPRHLRDSVGLVERLRDAGASRVIVNPGEEPAPAWCQAADVVVTFEGPWSAYERHVPAPWLRDVPRERLCHLVHSVPPGVPGSAVATRIAALGAGVGGVSYGRMPNPWTGSLLETNTDRWSSWTRPAGSRVPVRRVGVG